MAQVAEVACCNICDTDQDVRFYCTNCEENLCTNCKNFHSKFKTAKNHHVIFISEAGEESTKNMPKVLCGGHSNEEVTIYCVKCDQFICTECLNGSHVGHNLTSSKQMNNITTDQLVNLRKKLRDRKLSNENTLKGEGEVHTNYIATIKQCRTDISDQKEKIIKELNIICDEKFAELTLLEENEIKRYSEACTNIQKQQQVVAMSLQTIQNGIDSGHPAPMLQAKKDAIKSTGGLNNLTPAQLDPPQFHGARIEGQVLSQHVGSIHTKSSGAVLKKKFDVQTSEAPNTYNCDIEVNKIKTRSTIKVKDKTGCIKVIIPTKNNCTWVSVTRDKHLTMINDKGRTIRKSVTLERDIIDAKAYNNDILLTCEGENKVFRLSGDGTTKSVFSYLGRYKTLGLCVTNGMDVLVCLYNSGSSDNVVRLGKNGETLQIIQKDSRGQSLYSWPYRVTAAPSGEIIVTQAQHGKVTCVDRDGQHLFTWTGRVEGRQTDKCSTYGIEQDNYNVFVTDYSNSKVYALRKDGTGAKCLLDNTQGIAYPWGLALDDHGQLLVGCDNGKIHVIEYKQTIKCNNAVI